MKVLTRLNDNVALHKFADNDSVQEINGMLHIGNPVNQIIADCNFENCQLHENVSEIPEDFIGLKYTYDGNSFSIDASFVAMMAELEEEKARKAERLAAMEESIEESN